MKKYWFFCNTQIKLLVLKKKSSHLYVYFKKNKPFLFLLTLYWLFLTKVFYQYYESLSNIYSLQVYDIFLDL